MVTSTLTSWALMIHRALSAHAIDGSALFRRAGLDPDRLRDPNGGYPLNAMQRLWTLATATALNLSLRSMQRKLKARGVSFRKLLDDTRRQLAEQYLKDSTLSVSEIAYLLGFAEVSSFSRAFKRWTGHAPRTA